MPPPPSAYHFHLPPDLIAQHPPAKRDGGRLLHAADHTITPFTALPRHLRAGDLLVYNASRVLPARLLGAKTASGGKIEILLERITGDSDCTAQIRASRPPQPNTRLSTAGGDFLVLDRADADQPFHHLRAITQNGRPARIARRFLRHGSVPLPPYITRPATLADKKRYQTVYAEKAQKTRDQTGQNASVAAPTAGLHFSRAVLRALTRAGIPQTPLHLHVGAGTFAPPRPGQTTLHREHYVIPPATAGLIRATQQNGGRIIAVGTTTLRALESAARRDKNGAIPAGAADTTLFIRPGHRFCTADLLLTNFHLPDSTLFMLVCAFGGTATVRAAYAHAIARRLRFYSYGDAMLLPHRT